MEREQGRWKSRLLDIVIYLSYMLVGGVLGYIVAFRYRPGDGAVLFLGKIVLLVASLYVAVYAQILFHELGHLFWLSFYLFSFCILHRREGRRASADKKAERAWYQWSMSDESSGQSAGEYSICRLLFGGMLL